MKTAILAVLSAIPRWLWLLLAGALVLTTVLVYGGHKESKGYTAGYSAKTAEVEQAVQQQNQANRLKEQQLYEQIAQLQQNNSQLQEQLAIDKRSADQRVNAFSLQLEKTRKLLASAADSANAGVVTTGKTTIETARMLADLLGKSVERNRILAAYADDAGLAGNLCQQQYDQVRITVNAK